MGLEFQVTVRHCGVIQARTERSWLYHSCSREQRENKSMLHAYLHLACSLSYTARNPHLGNGPAHSGLGLFTSTNNQGNLPRICPQMSLNCDVPSLRYLSWMMPACVKLTMKTKSLQTPVCCPLHTDLILQLTQLPTLH